MLLLRSAQQSFDLSLSGAALALAGLVFCYFLVHRLQCFCSSSCGRSKPMRATPSEARVPFRGGLEGFFAPLLATFITQSRPIKSGLLTGVFLACNASATFRQLYGSLTLDLAGFTFYLRRPYEDEVNSLSLRADRGTAFLK